MAGCWNNVYVEVDVVLVTVEADFDIKLVFDSRVKDERGCWVACVAVLCMRSVPKRGLVSTRIFVERR
jgi:chorismate mutase